MNIYEIDKLPANYRVIIYGAGKYGTNVKNYIEQKRPDIKIVGFLDKEPKNIPPYNVFSYTDIEKLKKDFDIVIIASLANYDYIRQILIDFGIRNHIHYCGFSIGRYSCFGPNFIMGSNETQIGRFCSIAMNVTIGPGRHPTNFLSTHPFQYTYERPLNAIYDLVEFKDIFIPVTIGNDVWIGMNVVIQDGIKVGDGAIVGSGAIVTKDIPPYAIVGGVPAKIIRYRFKEQIIKEFLELKWWDLEDSEIAQLPFNDIEKCIRQLRQFRKKS